MPYDAVIHFRDGKNPRLSLNARFEDAEWENFKAAWSQYGADKSYTFSHYTFRYINLDSDDQSPRDLLVNIAEIKAVM